MLFNSIEFLIFLPVTFLVYWFVTNRSLKGQNLFIVIASYIFYGWWDWRFLSLIVFSTILDYAVGLLLAKKENPVTRKALLYLSLICNLGLLGVFKYFNFFIDSLYDVIPGLKPVLGFSTLEIILPVGISFYTFQTLSYSLDVYRKKLEPTRDFIAFAAFVSFFPQLVAGPIERASNLLPQMLSKRTFSYGQASDGIRLMLWGLFKKIVIADALAPTVNEIFMNQDQYGSGMLLLGAVFFSFQIYGDFSGYSDIARGLAKLLGFELMVNFNFPYFSRSIGEFWRKWHISLSTWFRDYLYIPLGGSKEGKMKGIRNVFIIFIVSGIWHGANWTFIAWGALHSLLFLPSFVFERNRRHLDDVQMGRFFFPSMDNVGRIAITFTVVTIAWVFFRAESIQHAFDYLERMFAFIPDQGMLLNPYDNQGLKKEFVLLFLFILLEYLLVTGKLSIYSRKMLPNVVVNTLLAIFIVLNTPVSSNLSFIYFQF